MSTFCSMHTTSPFASQNYASSVIRAFLVSHKFSLRPQVPTCHHSFMPSLWLQDSSQLAARLRAVSEGTSLRIVSLSLGWLLQGFSCTIYVQPELQFEYQGPLPFHRISVSQLHCNSECKFWVKACKPCSVALLQLVQGWFPRIWVSESLEASDMRPICVQKAVEGKPRCYIFSQ